MNVGGFKLTPSLNEDDSVNIGFILRKTQSQSAAASHLLQDTDSGSCTLDAVSVSDDVIVFNLNDRESWKSGMAFSHQFTSEDEGLYDIEFERCVPAGSEYAVSFVLDASFQNPGGNYLSAGEAPLPIVFLVFSTICFALLGYWCVFLVRNRKNVHKIHVLMAILLLVKGVSLLLDSATYHYVNIEGRQIGWTLIDDLVKGVKGVLLFGLILLIGTGWSFMKPFINEREKRIVYVVIPLQVVANIAMIVLDESAPGSQSWITWKDIFALADIICCCAVLFPIVWSIKRLRQAAQSDGKVHVNLMKLKQFQHFYVMVVSYIYFTRIIVYLLQNTLPFKYEYLGTVCREGATLIFFSMTGFYFRPTTNNPYLRLKTADHDGENGIEMSEQDEFGLGKDGPVDEP